MEAPAVSRLTTAAMGFCELGMWQDAWDEMEGLEPEDRAQPEVMLLRLQIFVGLKRWDSAAIVAKSLVEKGWRHPAPFLLGAYAIRRCRSLLEAEGFLLRAAPHLQENATWHYNLACYACQRGDTASAKPMLERAFRLNPDLRMTALEDEDLQPLW